MTQAKDVREEEPLAKFFRELTNQQERLGQDLERILAENLWDLYLVDTLPQGQSNERD